SAEGDEDRTAALSRTGFAAFLRQDDRDEEWPYKGFNKELVGLRPGDSKTVKNTYPAGDSDEAMRGMTVNFDVTLRTVRSVILPDLDDDFAKTTGAGETLEALRDTLRKDVENRSRTDYDDKYFVDLIEKIKEGAALKYAPQSVEHEGEHVLEDLQQRLSQQGLDLQTYFKMRNTTQEKFVEEEVQPVAKKRLERSLILDQIIRQEKVSVDNPSLDAEFSNTLTELQMQGMDLNQVRGGRQGQQRVAQAVAMESASRLLTRRALEILKSIAIGEYKPPEDREAAGVVPEPASPDETGASEPEASASSEPATDGSAAEPHAEQ
ncbi:MAG TPA: hypothetical protein VIU39_04215, partial [Anaerolineales bacterium]